MASRSFFRGLVCGIPVLLLSGSVLAWALEPNREHGPGTRPRQPATARAARVSPGAASQSGRAAAAFLARHPGSWTFDIDRRTGLATLVQGSGVPLLPGRGNRLDRATLAGRPLPDGEIGLETVEPLVRAFLGTQRGLIGPLSGRLALDRGASGGREGGRLWTVSYRWLVGEIPVEDAHVFVRLNSGNVTQFGAPLVGPITLDSRPSLDAGAALASLLRTVEGHEELARLLTGYPVLRIQPEEQGEEGAGTLTHRLVWVIRYKLAGGLETWEGRVDAHTGEVVSFEDVNAYGRAVGGVFPRTVGDTEVRAPFPDLAIDAGSLITDAAGVFPHAGGVASSGLNGRFFDTHCEDGCTGPPQPKATSSVGSGRLDFGVGGVDAVGNGRSSRADRNAFWHLGRVRRIGSTWLPSLAWMDGTIAVNVNVDATCNAFYDGAVNVYRSGGGCNNTGEIGDILHHEWGHGLDLETLAGDGATGEGTADVVAIHLSHDARIGPNFRTNGAAVRDLDSARTGKGLLTRANVGTKCGPGTGPLGYAVHCEGEILGQTSWDLAQALVSKHGHHTGWRTSERIFFTSLPDAGSYLPDRASPIYDAYLQADDDDGDLGNGTPNAAEIFTAFDRHGIAGAQRPTSPACARPEQPTLTVVSQCDRLVLSWTAVPGAARYRVLRTEVRADSAFFSVADLPATESSHEDTEVAPGVDYSYVLLAEGADGCGSSIEDPIPARLTAQPILSVTGALVDDVPDGNRSGFADPGEAVDLRITLANDGEVDAVSLAATLESVTPATTVVDGADTWPSIAPGATGVNQGVLRITTDPGEVVCGQSVRFRLVPDEGTGCASDASWFDVDLGARDPISVSDFESGESGYGLDPTASTAVTGHWTHGDPDGTTFQPEDDATPGPGRLCWFTAPNAGGIGEEDVDGGLTALLSPEVDLSGLPEARVSYSVWFGNRDLGEDTGDFFKAEASSDGGASWVTLETLGTDDTSPEWARRTFALEDFVLLTDRVRLRFQVADGPAAGNLVEAAIDDVRIDRPVCDPTPVCHTPPAFEGLAAAQPGSSCGEVALAWPAALSACDNAAVTYRVYRSAEPSFVPDGPSLVATGLTSTSFLDRLLAPGTSQTYVVRAHDSRSGEDANLARRTVTVPAALDLEAPVFAGLAEALPGTGCGEVVLRWAPAGESCHTPVTYEVYRSADPAFLPTAANRMASTTSPGFVDATVPTGMPSFYVVRARDTAGNEDANLVRASASSGVRDRSVIQESFDASGGGWSAVSPNDATGGRWDWGEPQGTGAQPQEDHTLPPGENGWFTGYLALGGTNNNDVDGGTTTLVSVPYDLTDVVDPVVRYARWFTNDRGANPGEDALDVAASDDDGVTWTSLEQVSDGSALAWSVREIPLAGRIAPGPRVRFRFTARDLGVGGSLVEAGVDDFTLLDRGQGCGGCPVPPAQVETIVVERRGDDVVVDWTADPVDAPRFVVYRVSGPGFTDVVRIGSTEARTFQHLGAALLPEDVYYRVSAVDACGSESSLE